MEINVGDFPELCEQVPDSRLVDGSWQLVDEERVDSLRLVGAAALRM